ncbi:DNA polymerase epsilon subunit B family protein [Trichomonas vaginalis G3]|uniref:DNA polymerase epsilon subunit n=1 Tax=Trichomonas vaginalis (strain ATCC PRA-98 / G3) TaxID=412133 RepID=A2EYI6_TRIV3|nr:error-prone translesion synthesis [Trichomonas vaginalis G3]EAY02262.1 DNA polymerase epsilon subunit B family protein [Trichomonas vaginalis G3]KAI5522910.1 error-prone translesion synthesis [Trichomonas vaginalis G3]|eukprot:XP_001314579.1 DNA polymerase epsilon subunit B family protein [Trichomonas vaginalis G3]
MNDRKIVEAFKMYQKKPQRSAVVALKEYLNAVSDQEAMLEHIINEIMKLIGDETNVDKEIIEKVLTNIQKQNSISHQVFDFQSAFDAPKFEFDMNTQNLVPSTQPKSILGKGPSKISLYRERFQILKYSLINSKAFAKSALKFWSDDDGSLSIVDIATLVSKPHDSTVVFIGILDYEGEVYTVEDESGVINLAISPECQFFGGILPVGCIVVVQGKALGDYVNALVIGHPPALTTSDFMNKFWSLPYDPFGWNLNRESMSNLQSILHEEHENALILVFSDVWIDVPSCVTEFSHVLQNYDSSPPNMIILCGSFTQKPLPFNGMKQFERDFRKFIKKISDEHTAMIQNSKFVFIPSLTDPGAPKVFPRLLFQDSIKNMFPEAIFMSNPCKIRFLSRTITVFRDDIMSRLARASPRTVPEENEHENLLITIIHQAHLTPTDLAHAPVAWEYDHTMRLFPAPDCLILADAAAPWRSEEGDTVAFNPGQFGNGGTFGLYSPAENTCLLQKLA